MSSVFVRGWSGDTDQLLIKTVFTNKRKEGVSAERNASSGARSFQIRQEVQQEYLVEFQ